MWYIKKEDLAKFCQKNKKERDTNITHTLTADRRLFANDIRPFSLFFSLIRDSRLRSVSTGENLERVPHVLESSLKLLESFHQNGRWLGSHLCQQGHEKSQRERGGIRDYFQFCLNCFNGTSQCDEIINMTPTPITISGWPQNQSKVSRLENDHKLL